MKTKHNVHSGAGEKCVFLTNSEQSRYPLGLRHDLPNELQVVVIYPEKEKKERAKTNMERSIQPRPHFYKLWNKLKNNIEIINIRPYGRNSTDKHFC